jgi:phosphoglucosamine mutase
VTASRAYFGTDGVRGIVGESLTDELVARLGVAFARWSEGCPVLVGRDTRATGPALEEALAAGLAAGGSPVTLGGVLPTPAVALLAQACGAVVSASHNPPEYNGVKVFARGGAKLTDEQELEVEARLPDEPPTAPAGEALRTDGLGGRYVELLVERFGAPLGGLRIACDTANGAMTGLAPAALERLGANVTAIGDRPDGTNINVGCGATDLTALTALAREGEFDLGVALDGDGDRLIAVDGDAREVDGDAVLAVLTLHLRVPLVVVTETTNSAFHRLMAEHGVRTVTTPVGDRYLLEALRREGGTLGGEQSGHVLNLDGHVSGDGLMGAILLARAVVESGRNLTELASVLEPYPQAKRNVSVRRKVVTSVMWAEIEALNARLDGDGRVLVRPSGTEPVMRVLAEAKTAQTAEDLCATVAALVERELG